MMMGYHHIGGLSGTGKSTIGGELARQGYKVVEADADFGYTGKKGTGEKLPSSEVITSQRWYDRNGWLWEDSEIRRQLCRPPSQPVFIEGGADNEENFYPLFLSLTHLTAPLEVLIERLQSRPRYDDTDPTGSQFYFEMMRQWHHTQLERAKKYGALILDTCNLEPSAAAAAILEHAMSQEAHSYTIYQE